MPTSSRWRCHISISSSVLWALRPLCWQFLPFQSCTYASLWSPWLSQSFTGWSLISYDAGRSLPWLSSNSHGSVCRIFGIILVGLILLIYSHPCDSVGCHCRRSYLYLQLLLPSRLYLCERWCVNIRYHFEPHSVATRSHRQHVLHGVAGSGGFRFPQLLHM